MTNSKLVLTHIDHVRLSKLLLEEKEKNKLDQGSLEKLNDELERATKVDPESIDPDVVTMNSVVKFTDMTTNRKMELKIVYPKDSDIKKNYVSVLAPVGMALLGYKKGDIVEWSVPGGHRKFLINAIIYQPEKNGEYLI